MNAGEASFLLIILFGVNANDKKYYQKYTK
jgi:hypothetical protein